MMARTIAVIASLALMLALGLAHPGVGIVVDSKGDMYYTDLKHMWKLGPDGTAVIAVRNVDRKGLVRALETKALRRASKLPNPERYSALCCSRLPNTETSTMIRRYI